MKYIFLALFVAIHIKEKHAKKKKNTDTSFLFNIYKRNVGGPKRFLSAQTDLNRSNAFYPCHFLLY